MNKELLRQALYALENIEDMEEVLAAISALRAALAQPAESTLNDLDYESFLAQLTEPDDRMFEQIDLWTRQSYARHKSSARGQMITAGDNVDSHRVWATLRWAKEFAQPVQPVLSDLEQYRMQMTVISTAALGYWKKGDSIHPDYLTVALNDVARLYQKYDALYQKHVAREYT